MGAFNKLDAVNRMMIASGVAPVASLDETSSNLEFALMVLQQVTDDIQLDPVNGSSNDVEKVLTTAGRLELSAAGLPESTKIASARLKSSHASSTGLRQLEGYAITTSSGAYLYNKTDNTDVWPADTYLIEVRYLMPFEHLDTHYQLAVISSASRMLQALIQGDDVADRFLAQKEMLSLAAARSADMRSRNRNIVNMPAFRGAPSMIARRAFDMSGRSPRTWG